MAEYEFSLRIEGVVVAYGYEDARIQLIMHPTNWGDVEIEELSIIPGTGDDENA
jgi:hypothetical protein